MLQSSILQSSDNYPSLFNILDDSIYNSQITSNPFFTDFDPVFYDSFPVEFPMEINPMEFEDYEFILNDDVMYESAESFNLSSHPSQQEDQWSPEDRSTKSGDFTNLTSTHSSSLTLPEEAGTEIDTGLSIRHLLKAYLEAMKNDQKELAEVILISLNEKISQFGDTLERIAFYLTHDRESDDQGDDDYLRQESLKNLEACSKAFYLISPYGKFAHYAANSAILESVPDHAEVIHIVDFDIGEGLQWPPVMEEIARRRKTLKLTAIKLGEIEDYGCLNKLRYCRFEETKKKLHDYGRSIGQKFIIEEMGIEDLVNELMKIKRRGENREWVIFNCMLGLKHMGKIRSRNLVEEFLRVAKDFLASSINPRTNAYMGLLILGEGENCSKQKNFADFELFFDGYLMHYQALLESMESSFPGHLAEARMAMECMFLRPEMSSNFWINKWKEMRNGCSFRDKIGLEGWRVSRENFMEGKEMVKGEKSYGVRIEGENENEMVLEWTGTPLVRVSTWRYPSKGKTVSYS